MQGVGRHQGQSKVNQRDSSNVRQKGYSQRLIKKVFMGGFSHVLVVLHLTEEKLLNLWVEGSEPPALV